MTVAAETLIVPEPPCKCVRCAGSLDDHYFALDEGLVCARCGEGSGSTGGGVFDAVLYGLLMVVFVTVAWGAMIHFTDSEFGLLGLAAGWAIGRAVRRGARQEGGRGYQALAVVLTYLAINLGLVGYVVASRGGEGVDISALVEFTLTAPFLRLQSGDGPMGVVILAVSLLMAWAAASLALPRSYSRRRGGPNPPGAAVCAACGTGRPETLMACPGCGVLANLAEVEGYVAQARAAEASGDREATVTALRGAVARVPAGSVSERRIGSAIDRAEAGRPAVP